MPYLHGAYGEIGDSKVTEVRQGSVICAYIGTAPVNLVRGYAEAGIINMPVKLTGMGDVQNKAGYSKTGWEDFTLCEVFAEHFDNTEGDIGPIYIVNVLNPDIHRDTEPITEELTRTHRGRHAAHGKRGRFSGQSGAGPPAERRRPRNARGKLRQGSGTRRGGPAAKQNGLRR